MKEYIFWGILIILVIIMIGTYAKGKKTFTLAFSGMMTGGIALIILHYFGEYINISLPVNLFNTAFSLILGIPGLILTSVINFLF